MKISIINTIRMLYWHPLFLRVVLYWNLVPFTIFIILSIGDFFPDLTVVGYITAFILTVLFVLYQWSFSFFTAQDVTDGKIGLPQYDLNELITDWGLKLKLLIIRFVYYLPLVLLGLLIILIDIDNPLLLAAGIIVINVGGFFLENTLLVGAFYQLSYTNSLLSSLNLIKVFEFVISNIVDLISIIVINILYYLSISLLLAIISPLMIIPFIGIIIFSVVSGFAVSWTNVYIPMLHGQIWQAHQIRSIRKKQ